MVDWGYYQWSAAGLGKPEIRCIFVRRLGVKDMNKIEPVAAFLQLSSIRKYGRCMALRIKSLNVLLDFSGVAARFREGVATEAVCDFQSWLVVNHLHSLRHSGTIPNIL